MTNHEPNVSTPSDDGNDETQLHERWRREIAEGSKSFREGRLMVWNEETLAGIKTRGRARLAEKFQQEK